MTPSILVRRGAASKAPTNRPTSILVRDILDARIGTTYQHNDADAEYDSIEDGQSDVLPPFVPLSFFDQLKPEQCREVEGKA